jgi:hypothetical protein
VTAQQRLQISDEAREMCREWPSTKADDPDDPWLTVKVVTKRAKSTSNGLGCCSSRIADTRRFAAVYAPV